MYYPHRVPPVAPLSEVRYARRGDVFIAYRVAGDGPFDVVLASGWMSHIEQNFEWPGYSRFVNGLSKFCRLILFDRRGTGLSDALRSDGTFEEASDDIVTVMDAVGSDRAAVIGIGLTRAPSISHRPPSLIGSKTPGSA